ncbi:MAG: ATP-binding protein [Gammaproteobacteria bacterium]
MGQSKLEIADGRAHTDASLEAERVTSDAELAVSAPEARRQLDDLIERDRTIADARLLKFRERVDRTLLRERSDSPPPNSSVADERDSADQRKLVEREITDALLQRERQRSDIAVESDRSDQDEQRLGLEARRQETNDQLSFERKGADSIASSLGETKSALTEAQTKEERHHDVLGMVTHDLRNPLSLISLSAESIAETTNEESTRIASHGIRLAAARMERLLSELLDVVRIESGMLRIVKRRHDVGALLQEVHVAYEPLFSARGITLTADTPPDGLEAFFDHDRIVQVLSNLLGNAMKFTPLGGKVIIHAERQADMVAVTVRDNGLGIPASALTHIFERFWQIDNNTRRGLGLGLHICEKIIQAHGGDISVESELGEGATLRFTLPTA